jgi:hypothetical protein
MDTVKYAAPVENAKSIEKLNRMTLYNVTVGAAVRVFYN